MEENKKEEKVEEKVEEKESMLGLKIIVIAIIIIGVGAGLFIVMPKNSSKESNEPASNTGVENTENNNIEDNNTENNPKDNSVDIEKIIEPFLIFNKCGGAEYLKDELDYNTIDLNAKIDIAYNHLLGDKLYEHELNKSSLIQAYKDVFGSDKEVELPEQLNISYAFASYKSNGDAYILEGQGGGCTGISEIITKTELESNNSNELVVKVKYLYVTTVSDSIDDFDTAELGVYNSKSKERLIRQEFTFDKMEEVTNEILSGDETDYILYTFKLEDNNYIFENAKIIKK